MAHDYNKDPKQTNNFTFAFAEDEEDMNIF